MPYVFLSLIVIFDVLGTTCMKFSNGFTNVLPSIGVVVSYALVYVAFAQALKSFDVDFTYAVWCACGVAVMTAVGSACFHEPMTLAKLASIAFIIIGIVGLQLS